MVQQFYADKYDVIVVGAGHAGCEAALACARLGMKTVVFSINLDSIAMMPCNPSIGGTGKGHLVREIDALGGQMGLIIDNSCLQSKMLNTRKGPAVHSLRAQADKTEYHKNMKIVLEKQINLDVKQAEIVSLRWDNNKVTGVNTATGAIYDAKVVILATGTYLGGKIFIGDAVIQSGPNGLAPSLKLTDDLIKKGIKMRRFKTGTPARVNIRSLNFDDMIIQKGDDEIVPFSFLNDEISFDEIPCWLTYTNEQTHDVINDNIHRSAMFSGNIEGTGPRYCPSIEDKITRFSDKDRHQLFIEPEGASTSEMYVQGMSTSLPEDVQLKFMRTIKGLENVEIMRPAYAIEYDCIDPLQLLASLEFKDFDGLFSAGQFNGSSGYEEAAAQGIIAGINAVNKIKGKEPFLIDRSEGYIGVLIDDLVTKGTNEPYRMMTSRAEYRLILRQDNADMRLTKRAYDMGLASEKRYKKLLIKNKEVEIEKNRLLNTMIKPITANEFLQKKNLSANLKSSICLADLLKRPEISYKELKEIDIKRPVLRDDIWKQCEIQIKYDGYIQKQLQQIKKFKSMEDKKLPKNIDYEKISGLRIEARQKLNNIRPESIGRASRISGVSPADISVLMVYLEQQRRERNI